MKKYLILIIALLFCGVASGYAQPNKHGKKNHEGWRELREFKMKYLAQEMELNKEQQQKFFAMYDEYSSKRRVLYEAFKETDQYLENNKNASEADYDRACEKLTDLKQKDAALEKEYDAKFATFLSKQQIYKMKVAEDKFKKKMAEMRHKRHNDRKQSKSNK